MSWIETVLDSESTSNAAVLVNKIQNILEEDENPKKIDPSLKELRKIASNLSSAAEEINAAGTSPRVIAGAMILLEMRFQETQITPEIFTNQVDQDFIQVVIRQIRGQGNKLITQLSSSEQDEVREMVLNARRMADYGYYASHFQEGKTLSEAARVVDKIGWRNSLLGLSVLWGGFVLLLIILALFPIFMLMNEQYVSAYVGFAFLIIIGAVSFIVLTRIQKAGSFKEAMAVIEELGDMVDLDRFDALHEELGGNKNRAIGFQNSAQTVLEKFFAGYSIPILHRPLPSGANSEQDFSDDEVLADIDADFPASYQPSIAEKPKPAAVNPPVQPTASGTPSAASNIPSQGIPQFCGECGTRTPSGAVFCPNCGHRVRS